MGKNAKKTSKTSRTKKAVVKDLDVKDAKAVKGGRKAGEKPLDYVKITMEDVLISQ